MRPGEVGEIVVSSKYLSPGYWRSPQLTIERFKNDSDTGRRYFTRDLGFKDAEGCLYHVGRADARVKVYGKLVLLTDIEQAILRVPGVTSAALIPFVNDESKNFELAAFVTVSSIALDKVYIRKELLKAVVPEFVPRKLMILAELPMLSSAKVDRQKLRQLVEASIW